VPKKPSRLALVTGANRGIGFEVCRQLAARGFIVLLTARDATKAREAANTLHDAGQVEPLVLDVADAHSIEQAAAQVTTRYGRLDVLINNAGIHYDTWETVENAAINGTVMEAIMTNLLGRCGACAKRSCHCCEGAERADRQRIIRCRVARRHGRRSACVPSHKGCPECFDAHARR
jgi:NAD(P)-dependent dehydrogenase (short-subunit alcohol dehydrogenase family)